MFDATKFAEVMSGFFGGSAIADALPSDSMLELLRNAGIDPAAISDLSQGQVFELLAQQGLDPGALGEAGLADLPQALGFDQLVGGSLSDVFDLANR